MQSTASFPPACLLCSPVFTSPHRAICRISQLGADRLDRGESVHDRSGLSFRSSSPAAIRRSAAQRAGFGLQNLLSIRLEVCGYQSDDRFQDFSSSTAAGQRAGGWPASHVHVVSLQGNAVNMTRKPCLTENGARKNDIGAPPGDRRQSRNHFRSGRQVDLANAAVFRVAPDDVIAAVGLPPLNSWHL
ncbi:hypothetical protein REMIM1_PB00134 (plasmid) [Rhizobium etli bv. mimosae str. Mim1]|nr:hypothetical protein REMIM1_PB00134 [Rhizobium etli bv. mimosae str. Mim1]